MAIKSGFFDSIEGDRVYSSKDFNNVFVGIIDNGVFPNIGNKFKFTNRSGARGITVGSGKAFIDGYWIINTADRNLNFDPVSGYGKTRADVIYLLVSNHSSVRSGSILISKGEESNSSNPNPVPQSCSQTNHVINLGYVIVRYSDTLSNSDIHSWVGTNRCPFCNYLATEGEVSEAMRNFNDVMNNDVMNEMYYLSPNEQTAMGYEVVPYNNTGSRTYITSGYLTGSRNNVYFNVRLPKNSRYLSSIDLDRNQPFNMAIRTVDGNYIGGGMIDWQQENVSVTVSRIDRYTIMIGLDISAMADPGTLPANNTPVSIAIRELHLLLNYH